VVLPSGDTATAAIGFLRGDFSRFSFDYAFGPGEGIEVFDGIYLTELFGGLRLEPTELEGGSRVSIGPSVTDQGCGTVDVRGNLTVHFGPLPFSIGGTGQNELLCENVGTRYFHVDSDGHAEIGEAIKFSIPSLESGEEPPLANVSGNLNGQAYVDLRTHRFHLPVRRSRARRSERVRPERLLQRRARRLGPRLRTLRGSRRARRVLHYWASVPAGTRITFLEKGTGGSTVVGSTTRRRGKIAFVPSTAKRGSRVILAALVSADGTPEPSLTVTRYAASPPHPGKPGRIHLRRTRRALRISFTRAPLASESLVTVHLSDGRRLLFVLKGRRHSLVVKVPPKVRVLAVRVRGEGFGALGPASSR
jgi:hypothetical protein